MQNLESVVQVRIYLRLIDSFYISVSTSNDLVSKTCIIVGRGAKEANLYTEIAEGIHAYGITSHRHGDIYTQLAILMF
jgi:hypothetical protein